MTKVEGKVVSFCQYNKQGFKVMAKDKYDRNIDLTDKREVEVDRSENGLLTIRYGTSALHAKAADSTLHGARNQDAKPSDFGLSNTIQAEIEDAVDACFESLIELGYLSLDSDYWIEGNELKIRDVFDFHFYSESGRQFEIRSAVMNVKALVDEFEGELDIADPFSNGTIVFGEILKNICESGNFLSEDWYFAKILEEYSRNSQIRNVFLIGVLWEQLRVKRGYENDFLNKEKSERRLKSISRKGTKEIQRLSNEWKSDAKRQGVEMLKEEPWLRGRWSEFANGILDYADNSSEEIRAMYKGKQSKQKPKGSELLSTETIAKFLSKEFGRSN